eukprot:SAG31_NODE_170_length_21415_cov_8.230813_7_plen_131_part_00
MESSSARSENGGGGGDLGLQGSHSETSDGSTNSDESDSEVQSLLGARNTAGDSGGGLAANKPEATKRATSVAAEMKSTLTFFWARVRLPMLVVWSTSFGGAGREFVVLHCNARSALSPLMWPLFVARGSP